MVRKDFLEDILSKLTLKIQAEKKKRSKQKFYNTVCIVQKKRYLLYISLQWSQQKDKSSENKEKSLEKSFNIQNGSSKLVLRGPNMKYFRLEGIWSPCQLLSCLWSSCRQYINEWSWLCFNKTFVSRNRQPAYESWFANAWYKKTLSKTEKRKVLKCSMAYKYIQLLLLHSYLLHNKRKQGCMK